MQTLTLTLAANQTVAFDIAGSYFEIIDSVGLVTVNFYDASGSRTKDLELQRVLSGFYVKGRYSRFEINEVSGSAQSVTVLYGSTEGGTRRSPGVVAVTNKIGATVQQIEISTSAMLNAGFLATLMVDPATNPRGMVIRRAAANAAAGANGTYLLRIMAAPTIPTVSVPLNAYQLAATAGGANTTGLDAHWDQNYQLPANWGVWAITGHTGNGASGISAALVYELL